MEIKSVEQQKIIEYPRINEISNIKVKHSIPDKWLKFGITSFLFNILMKSNVFAINISEISPDDMITAGVLPYYNPIYTYIKAGCNIVSFISALSFIISVVMIIYKKIKLKKQNTEFKISKKIKIVLILSIILFVLSRIGIIIVNYLK